MARNRTAFGRKYYDLEEAINTLRNRHIEYIKNDITVEDLKRIFVKPEHRQLLTDAFQLTNHGSTGYLNLTSEIKLEDKVVGSMNLVSFEGTFLVPKYSRRVCVEADKEPLDKLNSYLLQYYELVKEYTDAVHVLRWLNDNCNTPMQAKYLWPGILTLYKTIEHEKLDDLRLTKIPTNLPPIPAGFREVAARTAGVLGAASLLEKAPEQKAPVKFSSVTFKYPNPW